MSKGKSNRKKGGPQRQTSSLAQHRRTKKTLTPPLRSLPKPMTDVMWARDLLPDLLWIVSLLVLHGERDGLTLVKRTLDGLDTYLPEPAVDEEGLERGPFLSGTLTSFELMPEDQRTDALAAMRDELIYEDAFPCLFTRAMSKYEPMPGGWLLAGWNGPELPIVAADEPGRFLGDTVAAAMDGHSRFATLAKFMVVSRYAKAGRLHFDLSMKPQLEEVSRYPFLVTDDERSRIEPFIRSTFNALAGFPGDKQSEQRLSWAQNFWRSNWRLYPCYTSVGVAAGADKGGTEPDEGGRQAFKTFQSDLLADVGAISDQFGRAQRNADPDLYSPHRNEVLTGITARHVRAVDAMVRYPALWADEQGTFVMRNLLEGRIVLRWLVHKDDPALYERFKDYGRGHLKLQVLHLREYRDKLGDDGEYLDAYLDYLERLLNRDTWEEMQDISLDGNFAGLDTRRMALSVGMEDEYRLLFAPMSSDVHGEWASLDRYALVPCETVLHRRHRIPNPDRRPTPRPDLVSVALDHLQQLVEDYEAAVGAAPPTSDESHPGAPGAMGGAEGHQTGQS